jgi:orotate phosphoribosyltransferase-like protein
MMPPVYDMAKVIRKARARRGKLLAMRKRGMKIQAIADKLELSKQRVIELLARAKREALE